MRFLTKQTYDREFYNYSKYEYVYVSIYACIRYYLGAEVEEKLYVVTDML